MVTLRGIRWSLWRGIQWSVSTEFPANLFIRSSARLLLRDRVELLRVELTMFDFPLCKHMMLKGLAGREECGWH